MGPNSLMVVYVDPLGLVRRVEGPSTIVYWGYMGIMEKKMETTIVYWGYIGIMEKKMETTIVYGFEREKPQSEWLQVPKAPIVWTPRAPYLGTWTLRVRTDLTRIAHDNFKLRIGFRV